MGALEAEENNNLSQIVGSFNHEEEPLDLHVNLNRHVHSCS